MHVVFAVGKSDLSLFVIQKLALTCVKVFLRGVRELGLITAENMVESMAEKNARFDYDGKDTGWSPEFSNWYATCREKYCKEARDYLDEEVTNDEIDEEIRTELECWND